MGFTGPCFGDGSGCYHEGCGHRPGAALTFDAQESDESAHDRRGINFRWLASTVLTGVAGGALMGGALFIAFDRQSQFAESPNIQFAGLVSEAEGNTIGAGKGDRVVVRSDDVSSRKVIQETSVRRVKRQGVRQGHALCSRHRQSAAGSYGKCEEGAAVQSLEDLFRGRRLERRPVEPRAGRRRFRFRGV